jgi:hypothetical protein
MGWVDVAEHPVRVRGVHTLVLALHPPLPAVIGKFRLHRCRDECAAVVAVAEGNKLLFLIAATIAGTQGPGLVPVPKCEVVSSFNPFCAASTWSNKHVTPSSSLGMLAQLNPRPSRRA